MNKLILFSFLFLGLTIPVFFVVAGTIDPVNKYAWSKNIGWINFGCTGCNVIVTDTNITGYVWSQNFGWISLNCLNNGSPCPIGEEWGVENTNGTLSGYAWGENVGWINFDPPGPLVVLINTTTGQFSGTATGSVTGDIQFDLATPQPGTPVTTDWTPGGAGFCGDGTCNGSETCATCIVDCGTCGGGFFHNECNAQKQCVSVSGLLPDLCTSNNDCATHNICNLQNQCESVSGVGLDQCQTNNDCVFITHKECNLQNQCVVAGGVGIDQCQTDINCQPPKHNECNLQNQCVAVNGIGNNQCLINNDCVITHKECNLQNQCVVAGGVGIDQCQTDINCQPPKHNECNLQNQCVVVDGVGIDQCQINANCVISKHNECNLQNQCVAVNGVGNDQCQINSDCLGTHNECKDLQCVPVVGTGINQCSSNNDCQISKHNECNPQQQCVTADGAGPNQCQTNSDCTGPVITSHSECNAQKQCISVVGTGSDQCQESYDCLSITEKIIDVVGPIKKIIESPQGSVITKAISTAGIAVAIVVAALGVVSSFQFFDLFLILLRSFGFLLAAIGLRKRVVPWGVVYDSITKRPLDPAYVILKDLQGKTISSAITDMDGRYGFLVEPGVYQMQANKTNYSFPSQKLAGRTYDELHEDLYFGGNITVNKSGEVIIKNIPLDPLKFDWNEFAKKDKNLMIFYSKWDAITRKFFDWLFVIGFIVAIIAFIFAPHPYNTIIMILYVLLLVLRIFGVKPRAYGYVSDRTTGIPLSFAIIRVFLPDSQIVITSKVADKYGKYYCLVPPGKYYVKIEKKNDDGSYSLAYTSPIIDVSKKGIIKEKFKV